MLTQSLLQLFCRVIWIPLINRKIGEKLEKIEFRLDDNETVFFYVVEQTRIGGMNYLLVADTEEGDGQALILKDMSADTDEESVYEIVEDENELDAVSSVFSNMLEDVELERD